MMAYKKNRNVNGDIKKVAWKTFEEMYVSVEMFLQENIRGLIYLFMVSVFVLLCVLTDYIGYGVSTFLFVVSLFIVEYLFRLCANVKNESIEGIPVPSERYTQINDRGYITVMKEEESVQYLCSVEDYLEKKGLLKNDSPM